MGTSAPAGTFRYEGYDLLSYKGLRDHVLRTGQTRFQADQDSVSLIEHGDGNDRVESRFASKIRQHIEAVHPREIQPEEEQVGRAMP